MADRQLILDQFRRELREVHWGGETLEQAPAVTRRLFTGGPECQVYAHALEPASLDVVIREEVRLANERGRELEWKVFSFDSPTNLLESLVSGGFEAGPTEAVVVFDLSGGLGPLSTVDASCVRPITETAQLKDFRAVSEAAFGRDQGRTVAQLAEALRLRQTHVRGYVAYENGEPCSAGRLYLNRDSAFAGLYGGGTAPDFRGRGHYRALLAARAQDAMASGAKYLLVDALPTSLPILMKLGFIHLADTWPCTLS